MKFFTILILTFLFHSIVAQSNITIGNSYEEVEGKEKYFFDLENFIYTVKIKYKTSVLIQKIEKSSLKEVKKNSQSKIFEYGTETLDVLYANGKFYIFSITETDKREFAIHGTIINKDNLEIEVNNKKLLDIKEGIRKPYYQKLGLVFQSQDKDKFLVKYYKPLPADKGGRITVGLHVFDLSLVKMGGDEISMPFRASDMDDMGFAVDNDGTINVAGYNLEEEAYHLVKINPNDLSHKIVSTANRNFSYYNDFALNGDKNKYVAGFYDNAGTTQMYFIDLENSKQFEIDIPKELVPYDENGKKNTIMVHNAYVQEDGGLLVIAQELYGVEQYSYSTSSSGVTRSKPSSTSLIFNDFFVVRTNGDGTLKWINRIKKEKKSETRSPGDIIVDSPYLKNYKFHPRKMYHLLSKSKEHYFIFEDDRKENKGKAMYVCNINDETGEKITRRGFGYKRVNETKIYHPNVKKTITLGEGVVGAEVYIKNVGDTMLKVSIE